MTFSYRVGIFFVSGLCALISFSLAYFQFEAPQASAAGMRCFDNPSMGSVPGDVKSGQGELLSAGFIDVTKAPYNADKSGGRDASGAINRALSDGYRYSFTVYVPKGTYLLQSPLVARQLLGFGGCGMSNRKFINIMMGDTTGGTYPVLKAADGAFNGKTVVSFLFGTGDGLDGNSAPRHYGSLFRGFTIDMGNNPSGTALTMPGAQLCTIEDVHIKGNFNVGIDSLPGSGGSTTNVKIEGGNIGVLEDLYRPTPSIQGIELINQRRYGILLRKARGSLIIAGFKISGSGEAGVRIEGKDSGPAPQRSLVMTDGSFETGNAPAISASENSIHLRNIYAKSGTIVQNGSAGLAGNAGSWTRVGEFASVGSVEDTPLYIGGRNLGNKNVAHSGNVSQVSAPPANLLRIHAWDPAKVPTYFNTETLDIREYGATPDSHGDDDAVAINRALRDSVTQKKPVFIPRGRFNVRQPIEVPLGASMIGSSFGNAIIYADESWKPASRTALLRTEDGVGNVFLMDFAANGHEPSPKADVVSHNNMYIFHGRASNMMLRDVQVTRKEYYRTGESRFAQTIAYFSGNAGGRMYNFAFDFHESYDNAIRAGEHYMIAIEGTTHPLVFYQPNSESLFNDPQTLIKNAKNVTWYGFKYERKEDNELLHIINSDNIAILAGSGNYATNGAGRDAIVEVNGSQNIVVALLARQGSNSAAWLREDGAERVPGRKMIATYQKGSPKAYGELNPPDFPYPGSPIQQTTTGTQTTGTQTTTTNTTGTTAPLPLTGPCHLLTGSSAIPAGFGAPYEVFSGTRALLMKVTCLTNEARFEIGTGSNFQYHFNQAHRWNGSSWQAITLTGTNTTAPWIIGLASATIPLPEGNSPSFIVGYSCIWVTTAWKCGCRDQACATSMWQLQAYNKLSP